ncbi:MAG TPA: phosphoribosylaminoimidazolesuccinocarboxamide synthase [Firmicutes bacterium]|nr:phosphoribosylaminoimidazolesuccinocarboxamide synthase [Bacillota bacterium]
MIRGEKLYEGKAKIVYTTDDPDKLWVHFKDEATAFDGKKKGVIENKGYLNAQVSSKLFGVLSRNGVPTHFVRLETPRDMIVRKLEIIPVEVVVRNVVAGSMSKRLGIEEGRKLTQPVLEFYYKSDALGDPWVNESHVLALGWAQAAEVEAIRSMALTVNRVLSKHLGNVGILLVDFKLEFGRTSDGTILLGDEISPDTCRLWDVRSGEKLDKDRFRRDMGGVEDAYEEVLRRLS